MNYLQLKVKKSYFTLLELMVVLTLIGLVSSVGWYLGYAVKEEGVKNEVKQVWAKINLAKEMVLSYQVPITISFEKDAKGKYFNCALDYPEKYKLSFINKPDISLEKNQHIEKLLLSPLLLKKIDAVTFRLAYDEEIEKNLVNSFLMTLDESGGNLGDDKDVSIKSLSFYPPCDLPKGFLAFYSNEKKKCEIVLSGDFSSIPKIKWK